MQNKYYEKFYEYMKKPAVRYDERGKQIKRKMTFEEKVMSALGLINAMTLTGEYLTNEDLSIEEKNAVKEFVEFFLEEYGTNDRLLDMIDLNWPDGPRIFNIYEYILEQEYIEESQDIWELLTQEEKTQVKGLTNDIWSDRADRKMITHLLNDDDVSFELPKIVPHEDLESAKFQLKLYIARLLFIGGTMFYEKRIGEKHVIHEVYAFNRCLQPVPPEDVKTACEQLQDSLNDKWENVSYGELHIRVPEKRFQMIGHNEDVGS